MAGFKWSWVVAGAVDVGSEEGGGGGKIEGWGGGATDWALIVMLTLILSEVICVCYKCLKKKKKKKKNGIGDENLFNHKWDSIPHRLKGSPSSWPDMI